MTAEAPLIVLLPSPLLGPGAWRPVAAALVRDGREVVVAAPSLPPRPQDVTPARVVRALLAEIPAARGVVLVPHSNAGLFVPALVAQRHVHGYVFTDAGLPGEAGEVPLAPPAFLDFLRTLPRDDGLLPPWTHWWSEVDMGEVIPDAAALAAVRAEEPRLPLAYFQDTLPVPAGWDSRRGAYLAFGDTYAEERDRAAARGWPVLTLPGQHLAMLVDPDAVASAIGTLLTAIGFPTAAT